MLEHGIRDYRAAKQKAAIRLGVADRGCLPRNDEIEAARLEYQQLFNPRQRSQQLLRLRTIALQAMQLLENFQPRLVGPVLSGSAGRYDPVTLHLFCDTAEDVALLLLDNRVPFQPQEHRLCMNGTERTLPGYRFLAEECEIELVVFPANGDRQAPPSPVDGKPMHRAPVQQVERLLKLAGC